VGFSPNKPKENPLAVTEKFDLNTFNKKGNHEQVLDDATF